MKTPALTTDLSLYFTLENDGFFLRNPLPPEVEDWGTSQVIHMIGTIRVFFDTPSNFNRDIGGWDTSSVTAMNAMFQYTARFNQDIGGWDTSQVTTMLRMFFEATAFNQDIGEWDMSNVTQTSSMFFDANSFNQDIGSWDVSKVSSFSNMFHGATSIDQDLGGWDISSLTRATNMFDESGMSMANLDVTLAGWARLDAGEERIPANVRLGLEGLTYSNTDAINTLIDKHGWNIEGGAHFLANFLVATEGNDVLDGSDVAINWDLDGLEGDDLIFGSSRNDRLLGSAGNVSLDGEVQAQIRSMGARGMTLLSVVLRQKI